MKKSKFVYIGHPAEIEKRARQGEYLRQWRSEKAASERPLGPSNLDRAVMAAARRKADRG